MASDEFGIDMTIRPRLIANTCALPRWPPDVRRDIADGVTQMMFTVSDKGEVLRLEVTASSGSVALDAAAVAAYASCRFEPATQNRVPVLGEVTLWHGWSKQAAP